MIRKNCDLRILGNLLVLTVVAVYSLTSCVQGDLYDLYDDYSCDSGIPRRKVKQDIQTIGGSQPDWLIPNTCFLCVAAYYASGKTTYSSDGFKNYYLQAKQHMLSIHPGFNFGTDGASCSEMESLLNNIGGRSCTYNECESIEELFNIIGTVEGVKAHEYVIRGKFLSSGVSDGHVAVLSSLKKKKNGKVVINTFDPGPGASVLDSIWGYYN